MLLFLPPTWAGARFSHPLPCTLCVAAFILSGQVTCVSLEALCFVLCGVDVPSREFAWTNLLHINNLFPVDDNIKRTCAPWT